MKFKYIQPDEGCLSKGDAALEKRLKELNSLKAVKEITTASGIIIRVVWEESKYIIYLANYRVNKEPVLDSYIGYTEFGALNAAEEEAQLLEAAGL